MNDLKPLPAGSFGASVEKRPHNPAGAAAWIVMSTIVLLSTISRAAESLSNRSALLYEAFAKVAIANERKEVIKWSRKDSITVALHISERIPETIATDVEQQIDSDLSTLSEVTGKSIRVRAATPNGQPADGEANVLLFVGEDPVAAALATHGQELEAVLGRGIVTNAQRDEPCLAEVHVKSGVAEGSGSLRIVGAALFVALQGDASVASHCLSERLPRLLGLSQLTPAPLYAKFGDEADSPRLKLLDLELLRGLYQTPYLEGGESAERALRLYRAYLVEHQQQ